MELDYKNRLARTFNIVFSGLWAHLPLVVVLLLFSLASKVFLDSNDHQMTYHADGVVRAVLERLQVFLVGAGIIGLLFLALQPSRERSVKRALRWLAGLNWAEIVLLRVPVAFFFMSLISHHHLNFKVNIANFAPYTWDHFFAQIDRLLFLGYDPWVITHWVFSGLNATLIMDSVYLMWFLVLSLSSFSIAVLPMRNHTRLTYLLAYGLNWAIGGAFLAIVLPAVGPVYMERITGDPMFAPLMDLLYGQAQLAEIRALGIQELLWDGYTKPDANPFGLSAFPSLHVEMAATSACLGFAVSRILGWFLAVYTAVMLVASVHLGWHYAIDGIAGIALAILFWRISARVTRWWLARTAPGASAAATEQPVAAN